MESFYLVIWTLGIFLSATWAYLAPVPLAAAGPEAPFLSVSSSGKDTRCQPTAPDALGPFYQPGAPERASVGQGYILTGKVLSSVDCSPIEGARLEFWLAGPDGNYDDDHRATVFTDQAGGYRFESNIPPQYSFRPPHIHLRVAALGFKTLVTQHYPTTGHTQAIFDLVLVPAP